MVLATSQLKHALELFKHTIPQRSRNPYFSQIMLEADPFTLKLSGGDTGTVIETSFPVQGETLAVALPYHPLLSVIAHLPGETLTLSPKEGSVYFEAGLCTVQLFGNTPDPRRITLEKCIGRLTGLQPLAGEKDVLALKTELGTCVIKTNKNNSATLKKIVEGQNATVFIKDNAHLQLLTKSTLVEMNWVVDRFEATSCESGQSLAQAIPSASYHAP